MNLKSDSKTAKMIDAHVSSFSGASALESGTCKVAGFPKAYTDPLFKKTDNGVTITEWLPEY